MAAGGCAAVEFCDLKEGSSSFLQKRTKKLLPVWARCSRKGRSQMNKSFLLLFFKKEVLAYSSAFNPVDRQPDR
jgi:hypothetical protein